MQANKAVAKNGAVMGGSIMIGEIHFRVFGYEIWIMILLQALLIAKTTQFWSQHSILYWSHQLIQV